MNPQTLQRPPWPIDRLLDALVGHNVRVAAESFSPVRWNGELPHHLVSTHELVLPDNSHAQGLPLYFEGRLRRYVRQISTVYVELAPLASLEDAAEGKVFFRGAIATILQGPAVVKLAFPFRVEQLPPNPDNYLEDLRVPRVQFNLPL